MTKEQLINKSIHNKFYTAPNNKTEMWNGYDKDIQDVYWIKNITNFTNKYIKSLLKKC